MPDHVAEGEPRELDTYLAPAVRIVLVGLGALGSLVLALLGWWWWLPVPLAAGVLGFELWRFQRSDRPIRLELGPDIRLVDQRGGQTLRVALDDVRAATCWHRQRGAEREVVLALYGDTGALLALAFRLPRYAPSTGDLDADAWDERLGGVSGIVNAVAPRARACRQWFADPQALAWLRAHVPPAAWEVTTARGWTGAAPSMDLFGYLEGSADTTLFLEGKRWWTADGRQGALDTPQYGSGDREAVLFRLDEDRPDLESGRLPLLTVRLGTLELAVPCPAGVSAPPSPETDTRIHLQVPEGAALLAHLEASTGATRAPTGLAQGAPTVDPSRRDDTTSPHAGPA